MTMVGMLESSASGCPQPPGYGFTVHSVLIDYSYYFPLITSQVGQTLMGDYSSSISGELGDRSSWENDTNFLGNITKLGAATPARWKITWVTKACSATDPLLTGPNYVVVPLYPSSDNQDLDCNRYPIPISASPDSAQNGTYAEVTMSSSSAFLEPYPTQFELIDSYGNVLGSGAATMMDDYDCYVGWNNDMDSPPGAVGIQLETSDGTAVGWAGFTIY